MKRGILEFWVGVFVLLGIFALGFLSIQVAGSQMVGLKEKNSYTLYANFSDIGGLKVKAPVKSAGVVVGRVEKISLNTETYQAKVQLAINNEYKFSTDVSAEILTSGILGEQYIGLLQGADEDFLHDKDTISITSSALVLEQLIGKFMTNTIENKEHNEKEQ